ncbi:tetratricopeptide repeat protein 16 [Callorhinchus milii]|uniref:tetratricopeptide repeat protein 16 n=1 Tax=Callorhinchus milii TaxID=7868 RepID=UPI001C3F7E44|nr:tetratricopeptide repeat protein 16 [Callorhinchus milii]
MPADLFPKPVSEQQLEEAWKESLKNLFGSSQIFEPEKCLDQSSFIKSTVIHDQATTYYEKGLEMYSSRKLDKAVTLFSKAISLQPERVELYVSLADAYLQFCDFQSAIMNYRRAYTLNPGNEELQLQVGFTTYIQGQCLFEMQMYSEALGAFTEASELCPENQGYQVRRIVCLAALGRFKEALQVANKLVMVQKNNPELYILRARIHDHFGNVTLCNSDITAALAMDPTCLGALSLKSRLGERAEEAKAQAVNSALRGQMKEAMQKINKALENNPNEANYYILRGTLYRKLKEFNAAIDDYLFALDKVNYNDQSQIFGEAQGQLLLTYNDFAVYCYQRGFYEEAILLLNQAIRGEKQQKGLYINRGDCFFKKENLEYALLDYEQALDLDNKDHNIKDRIAIVRDELGLRDYKLRKYLDAEKNFTIAIQNSPRAAMYYLHRAKAQRFMEHLQQSQEDVVTALLLDSQHKEVMPLVTQLFPGKSVDEILASELGEHSRAILKTIPQLCEPYCPPTAQKSPSVMTMKSQEQLSPIMNTDQAADRETRTHTLSETGDRYLQALREQEHNEQIIMSRRKLNLEVKNTLRERIPLSSEVPRIPRHLALWSQRSRPRQPGRRYDWKKRRAALLKPLK